MSVTHPPVSLPTQTRTALVRAVTPPQDDPGSRVLEVVWTTGARRVTWTWEDGCVDEALDLAGADLSRLNNRAPLLSDHYSCSIESVLGVVVPGSAVIDGTEGRARVQLSRRADLADLWQDLKDGVLGQVSVGYSVEEYVVTREDGQRPLYRAARWTPLEISLVAIGADPGAQVARSTQQETARSYPVVWRSASPQQQQRKAPPVKEGKEKQRMSSPNTKKRAMTDDQKASLRAVLAEYGVAEDKLDAAVEACAALWPEETTAGEGEMSEAARALGTTDPSPAGLARAATALRSLFAATEQRASKAESAEDVFARDAAQGKHRLLGPQLARTLFDGARALYDEQVGKVAPLVGQAPPAGAPAGTRATVADAAAESAGEAQIQRRTAELEAKGTERSVARRQALREYQATLGGGVQ